MKDEHAILFVLVFFVLITFGLVLYTSSEITGAQTFQPSQELPTITPTDLPVCGCVDNSDCGEDEVCIFVDCLEPTPTITPTVTPTHTPTVTPTDTPTLTPTATGTPGCAEINDPCNTGEDCCSGFCFNNFCEEE